jgi:hypothetical protein
VVLGAKPRDMAKVLSWGTGAAGGPEFPGQSLLALFEKERDLSRPRNNTLNVVGMREQFEVIEELSGGRLL